MKPTLTRVCQLHPTAVYDQIGAKFKLSANLAVRVCARVGANRKTAQQKGKRRTLLPSDGSIVSASPIKSF